MTKYSEFTYNYIENCSNCGSTHFHNMGKGTNPNNYFHKMVVQCKDCGLLFTNPIADRPSMEKFYSGVGEGFSQNLCVTKDFQEDALQITDAFKKRNPQADKLRFLDVGSSSGEIMKTFHNAGWEVWGIEVSESSVKFAKEHFGLQNILTCEIEDAPFEENYFDYINFWHVIEHLRDPIIVLKKIYSWLKPGGQLKIGTPNPVSKLTMLNYTISKRFDLGPDHTFGFPPATLNKALRDIGFKIEYHKVYRGSKNPQQLHKKIFRSIGLHNTLQKTLVTKPV